MRSIERAKYHTCTGYRSRRTIVQQLPRSTWKVNDDVNSRVHTIVYEGAPLSDGHFLFGLPKIRIIRVFCGTSEIAFSRPSLHNPIDRSFKNIRCCTVRDRSLDIDRHALDSTISCFRLYVLYIDGATFFYKLLTVSISDNFYKK